MIESPDQSIDGDKALFSRNRLYVQGQKLKFKDSILEHLGIGDELQFDMVRADPEEAEGELRLLLLLLFLILLLILLILILHSLLLLLLLLQENTSGWQCSPGRGRSLTLTKLTRYQRRLRIFKRRS